MKAASAIVMALSCLAMTNAAITPLSQNTTPNATVAFNKTV